MSSTSAPQWERPPGTVARPVGHVGHVGPDLRGLPVLDGPHQREEKQGAMATRSNGNSKTVGTDRGDNIDKYIFKPTIVMNASSDRVQPTRLKSLVLALHCPAGTGATVYNGWVSAFKRLFLDEGTSGSAMRDSVDVVHLVPIELPGRSLRMKEPLVTRMDDLAGSITSALESYIEKERLNDPSKVETYVGIFGHSLGGWIGFEVMRRLVNRLEDDKIRPLCLIASGIRSPTLHGVENDIDSTAMHMLSESDFWNVMERRYGPNKELEHPSVRRMMWPILKADFTVSETYVYDGGVLDMPLYVSGGRADVRYDQGMLEAWAECSDHGGDRKASDASFKVDMFDGGHHYLFSIDESMERHVAWVMARLKESLALMPKRGTTGVGGKEAEGGPEIERVESSIVSVAVSSSGNENEQGSMEDFRGNRSDRASMVSEVESMFANPGTTRAMSDAVEMADDMETIEAIETIEAMETIETIETIEAMDRKKKTKRTESNEPRCSKLCLLM